MRFKHYYACLKKLGYGLVLGIGLAFPCQAEEFINIATTTFKQQLAQAESNRDNGNYLLAEQQFNAVLLQAKQQHEPLMQAMASGALGYNFYLMRSDIKAQELLQNALAMAKPLGYPALNALLANYLGMLQLALQHPDAAAGFFHAALSDARLAHDQVLEYSIRLNQAKLESVLALRCTTLQTLSTDVLQLKDDVLKANLLLNLGEQLLSIPQESCNDQNQAGLKTHYQVLDTALQLTKLLQQSRMQAQAQAYLAKLYLQQENSQDALLWLEQAIFSAQQINAKDLLMQFETQRAQLLHKSGNTIAALAAYRRAVQVLTDIQRDLPLYLHDGQSSMKKLIDPAYRGLADILLSQAQNAATMALRQNLIKEAITVVEASKQAELEDFFKDRCLIDSSKSINLLTKLMPGVAIVYPVIFDDRIEILFRLGEGDHIEQTTIPVLKTEVVANALQITERLHNGKDYRSASYKLYDWLIRAYQESLKAKSVKTLVYVPDGVLRQVPIAALNDGKSFIVESYSSVTLPGLELEYNEYPASKTRNALIAGLSKPDGPSLDQLPPEYIQNLMVNSVREDKALLKGKADISRQSGSKRDNLVAELSLPGIDREVAMLQTKMLNKTLLNHSFTFNEFQQSINSGTYSIVHIASHGYFGKHAEDSFIMAYDRNFKLSEFQSLLKDAKPGQGSLDLITLNACETADGDDRALLGFSGIAVKTNTLSAIGTLWPINDEAAVKFMSAFYDRLGGLTSKAEALRQAQLTLLKEKKFSHPYFWSPFILVGNW